MWTVRAAIGLIPPAGEAGGTAPEGYTLYLNAFFTLVFAAQLWIAVGPGESGGEQLAEHSHEHAG